MTKFIEVQQGSTPGWANTDHIVVLLPSDVIGECNLVLFNGMVVSTKGGFSELAARLNG